MWKTFIRTTMLVAGVATLGSVLANAQQRSSPSPAPAAAVAPAASAPAAQTSQERPGVPEGAGIETGNLIGTVPFTAQEQLLLRPDDKAAIRKMEDKHVKELRDLEDKYAADLRALRIKQAEEREGLRKTFRR